MNPALTSVSATLTTYAATMATRATTASATSPMVRFARAASA